MAVPFPWRLRFAQFYKGARRKNVDVTRVLCWSAETTNGAT